MKPHASDKGLRPLQQLPPSTQSKIRSTQILTSLPQVISELVQNSLDAGASHIDVGVDCEDWACWVRDDGAGIGRDDFDALAGGDQAIRYSTSKAYSPASLDQVSTFGFRGEALASAADVSCLEISSRTARSRESWSVILKEGKTLYHGRSLRWRRESPGTVVSVRDAFYNLPIRRRSHPSAARTLELVRRDIETFALMFPNVAFSVENTHKTRSGTTGSGKVMIVPKVFCVLILIPINTCVSGNMHVCVFKLEHCVVGCEDINKHLMSPCDLHRVIESRFSRSSFAKHVCTSHRRSPRKSEKKPVYVLNLTVPPREVDNCLEPAKAAVHLQNAGAASTFLSSVVDSFLLRHGFLHATMPKPGQERRYPDSSVSKKRKVVCSSDYGPDTPTRAGTSRDTESRPLQRRSTVAQPHVLNGTNDRTIESDESTEVIWIDPATGERFVVDTRTGNSYPINSRAMEEKDEGAQHRRILPTTTQAARTRNDMPDWIRNALEAYAQSWPTSSQPRHPLWRGSKRRVHDCLSQTSYPHASQGRPGSFSRDDLLNAQVLGQVDQKFIACVLHTDFVDDVQEDIPMPGGKVLVLIDQHAADERVRVERFLQELCLGFLQHRTVSRVDHLGDESSTVVGIRTRSLEPPTPILLTRHEAEILYNEDIQAAFRRWGIAFSDSVPPSVRCTEQADVTQAETSESGYSQVHVDTVPELLGDKLLTGSELRDLVKGYIAKLEAEGTSVFTSIPRDDELSDEEDSSSVRWQKAMRWCPRELHDLVNSKACRGAIMFNDTLTHEQCIHLVAELARTAFPFQCAHGRSGINTILHGPSINCCRPSLVPLTEIARTPIPAARTGNARIGIRATAVDWAHFSA
ncbi:hypothetical protein DAEQUDRAFT_666030 [Daedalea quercina L-15889]|uniref:MutL C-terminal dimerisation domain-containing protein n=1 Tax=Daedalea quercina L-15889 TaxID=1314783 RepID=A0A165S239_9APHY|nr:hypothetical protein DAEQUDRAFT_666030 [Daedalea quercina L-15889]